MQGEPIEAVNTGVRMMVSALRQDPYALETVHVCIMTFDADAKLVVPLTALDDLQLPLITTPKSGPTHLGLALEMRYPLVQSEVKKSTGEVKGDWAPYLFVMTDGKPSDTQLFQAQCPRIRTLGFSSIIGCVAGPKARKEDLQPLCDHVVSLETLDNSGFTSFFRWVTATISGGNKSLGISGGVELPPPPAEINVVSF